MLYIQTFTERGILEGIIRTLPGAGDTFTKRTIDVKETGSEENGARFGIPVPNGAYRV